MLEDDMDQPSPRAQFDKLLHESCVHLKPKPSQWLANWGTPEGRALWLQSNAQYSKDFKAANARWRYLKKQATSDLRFEYSCEQGHECRCIRTVIFGSQLDDYQGPPECDRQETCRDYVSIDTVLERIAKNPRGNA